MPPTSIQCLATSPPPLIQLSGSAAEDCGNCHLQLIACFCGPASTGAGTRGKYCDHLSREQDAEVALIDSRCSIMHPRLYCCCDFSLHQPQPPIPIWQKVHGYQFIGNFEHAMKPSLLVVCSVCESSSTTTPSAEQIILCQLTHGSEETRRPDEQPLRARPGRADHSTPDEMPSSYS